MVPYENPTLTSHYWLVVWNMNFMFPFSWKCHNPNWRTPLFFRGVGIPPTGIIWPLLNDVKLGLFNHQITIRHSNHHSITINKPTIQSPWNHHSITIFLWFSYGFPTIQSVEISNVYQRLFTGAFFSARTWINVIIFQRARVGQPPTSIYL